MNIFTPPEFLASRRRSSWRALFLAAVVFGLPAPGARAAGAEDDNALETEFADVLAPDVKQGFMLRQDTWNGSLPTGVNKPIAHQFFKGNEYHLYVRTDVKGAKVSVHVYDGDGNLAEAKFSQKETLQGSFSVAEVVPKYTGRYYLIVKVDQSSEASTSWDMAYAYK